MIWIWRCVKCVDRQSVQEEMHNGKTIRAAIRPHYIRPLQDEPSPDVPGDVLDVVRRGCIVWYCVSNANTGCIHGSYGGAFYPLRRANHEADVWI